MRVLEFAAYGTIDGHAVFSRNASGYGYMTMDIATSIAATGTEVDFITQSYFTKAFDFHRVSILKRSWLDVLREMKFENIRAGITAALNGKISAPSIGRALLYELSMGYIEKLLRENSYDLVHIHGITPYTLPVINLCERLGVKMVVTLHGLSSFEDNPKFDDPADIEKSFLARAEVTKIPVTVISTGVRKRILSFLERELSDNFEVIPNGVARRCGAAKCRVDLRQKYRIAKQKKIALCVGNICERKNQLQVVRSLARLSSPLKDKLVVVFLGGGEGVTALESEIEQNDLKHTAIYGGYVSRDTVESFYAQADFTILASLSEGFGLSIIEGFLFGLPCLTFRDLDAVRDVYDEGAVVCIDHRSDDALCDGIAQIMEDRWDRVYIKKFSERFSLEQMALSYIRHFERELSN